MAICEWARTNDPVTGLLKRWDLMVHRQSGERTSAARVWPNGVWHTFDQDGVGGENDVESDVRRAKIEAAASAVEQGFV